MNDRDKMAMFAMHAMVIATTEHTKKSEGDVMGEFSVASGWSIARAAYATADAMIAERTYSRQRTQTETPK